MTRFGATKADWANLECEQETGIGPRSDSDDEARAAATFAPAIHDAAAVITFLSPGLRFFHQGQFEARKKRISPHLVRGPAEPVDERVKNFYDRLLAVLRHDVVATATGDCSNAFPLGTATGHGIVSWFLPGKAPVTSGCW
jgi:hypothetical protein